MKISRKVHKLLKKYHSQQHGIYNFGWKCTVSCPRCAMKSNVSSKDIIVTTFSDWGGERFYNFRVFCGNCNRLSIVIPKNTIPENVKENVLASSIPLVEDVLRTQYNLL